MSKKLTKEEIELVFQSARNLEKMQKDIQNFIKDSSNSFEDRFNVFVKTPVALRTSHNWIIHLYEFEKKYDEIDWYGGFHFARYQDIDLIDLIKKKDNYSYTEDWSDEQFRDFQEAVLDLGYHSFTLDW